MLKNQPQLEKLIGNEMTAAHLPGLGVVVIEDGQNVWQSAYGVRSLETDVPVTTDTIFEAASLSKPVAAYGAIKLVERGLLDLDKPKLAKAVMGDDLPGYDVFLAEAHKFIVFD